MVIRISVEENLRLVDEMLDAFNAHDVERFVEFHSESAVHYQPTQPEPLKGRAAIREDYINVSFNAFPDVQFEKVRVFGQGDWVCIEGLFKGTHKAPLPGPSGEMIPATNKFVQVPICLVVRVEGGKVVEFHEYNDQLVLVQLGIKV